jgi:hypothetical protein
VCDPTRIFLALHPIPKNALWIHKGFTARNPVGKIDMGLSARGWGEVDNFGMAIHTAAYFG